MKRLSFVSLFFLTHFLLVALTLVAATIMGRRAADEALVTETTRTLERALPLFSERLRALPEPLTTAAADDVCKRLSSETGFRFTLMNATGTVLGDGEGDPRRMRNHAGRPEFRRAMQSGSGTDRRMSDSVHREMLYHAALLQMKDRPDLVVRVAVDVELLREPLRQLWETWRGISILLLLLAGGLSFLLAQGIARPLQRIRQRVSAFEQGQFEHPVPHSRVHDLNALADALNHMARRLDDRIRTVERQRDEEDALFSCMVEGVVAIDSQKKILRINRSAAGLFGVGRENSVAGQSVYALIRNPEWIRLFERVLEGESPVEGRVELEGGAKVLQAHGAALTGPGGQRLGALLVFNDVTELSRIETMQRDFVANVSHELKTPITSIKGFAETLLDGADEDADARRRFLKIMLKQANRLQSIVTDILSLAALENGMRSPEAESERVLLNEVLDNALLPCRSQAESADIRIDLSCNVNDPIELYPFFLEQAVTNLVDNAIKFSPPGSVVDVRADILDRELVIQVIDRGPGIAREHHERLWERFYRVDRGRSRRLGGTGLGLAIVRRVANLHGGRAEVESEPGAGCTFRICIPHK